MDGIINLAKPAGITSAKAVYRIRRITRIRKSGHAGTLDPAATGVLLVCQGKATKLVESVMDQPKVYWAKARLDVTSSSFDADRPLEPVEVGTPPKQDDVERALAELTGDIVQTPPAISAVKIGGIPAYKLAFQGENPVLRPRLVKVYWIHVHSYAWPYVDFEMACGRGVYVRSIIRDVGLKLETGGCLEELARVSVGPFHQDDGWTFERLENTPPEDYIVPLETARDLLSRSVVPPPPSGEATGTERASE